ncbi:MAG: hypothetical protein ACR2LP_00055 [Candidatus Limnocylindrales bacterium]
MPDAGEGPGGALEQATTRHATATVDPARAMAAFTFDTNRMRVPSGVLD